MIKKIIFTLLSIFHASTAFATTYYVDDNGDDGAAGTSTGAPWATFAYADSQVSPGDTVIVMDGTYDETLNPTTAGTVGSVITWQAQNRGAAVISRTTDGFGIYIESTPADIKAYITIDGFLARSHGEYEAIRVDSQDNSAESEMTHDIIVRNCGAFGSANLTNTMTVSIARVRDSLIEDSWSYGFGRKSLQVYGSLRVTTRRYVARNDYWDGSGYLPNDPRNGVSSYNSHDCVFENIIAFDCAPDPPDRTSAAKSGFTLNGNTSSTALLQGTQRNSAYGLISLDNDNNQIELSGHSGYPVDDNILINVVAWGGDNNGIVLQDYADSNTMDYVTIGSVGASAVRANTANVTNNDLSFFALTGVPNTLFADSGSGNSLNNYSAVDSYGADVEAAYMPTISYLVQPEKVVGFERGATIYYRYEDGVLTGTKLWPWPNEALIQSTMCDATDLAAANRVAANGAGWEPAWCASGKTLTSYIWGYMGSPVPSYSHTLAVGSGNSSVNISGGAGQLNIGNY